MQRPDEEALLLEEAEALDDLIARSVALGRLLNPEAVVIQAGARRIVTGLDQRRAERDLVRTIDRTGLDSPLSQRKLRALMRDRHISG